MAQRVEISKWCDRPPHRGEADATETRHFEWGGTKYEIDVCPEHDKELAETFRPFADAARRGSVRPRAVRSRRALAARDRVSPRIVRAWLQEHVKELPYPVGSMGRIPADLMDIYRDRAGSQA